MSILEDMKWDLDTRQKKMFVLLFTNLQWSVCLDCQHMASVPLSLQVWPAQVFHHNRMPWGTHTIKWINKYKPTISITGCGNKWCVHGSFVGLLVLLPGQTLYRKHVAALATAIRCTAIFQTLQLLLQLLPLPMSTVVQFLCMTCIYHTYSNVSFYTLIQESRNFK